jgi:hypothetical protein
LQFGHKKYVKLGLRKAWLLKRLTAIKKEPSTLHWDNRKDALRTSQELTDAPIRG